MATFIASLIEFSQVHIVLSCAIGSVIGFIIGAIPGLGPTVGVALAIPFSLRFNHNVALMLFMGIYSGAEFGGCISSILINVPGTGAAAATVLDGFPMAKKGRAITAISISTTASAFGGILAPLILILMLPIMSKIILIFGTPEFFLLSILGLTCIAAVSKGSMLPGLITGAFGLMLCTIGIAPSGIEQRYTFGSMLLFDGFDFLPAIIGVFGVAEMLKLIRSNDSGISETISLSGSRYEGVRLTILNWKTALKSSLIGLFIGLIPAVGATTASFFSWAEAKRCSKNPEEFGNGCPTGVVATEASNNSVVSGSLMPTLLFGIPGSGTAAVILGGVMMHGLNPGRELFSGDGLITTEMLLIGLIASSLFLFVFVLFIAPYLGKVTIIRKEILVPIVFILASLGIYSINNNLFDVALIIIFGIFGYLLNKGKFPIFPLVLALILGNMVEENYLRCLQLGQGSLWFLFSRPASLVILLVILIVFIYPLLEALRSSIKSKKM